MTVASLGQVTVSGKAYFQTLSFIPRQSDSDLCCKQDVKQELSYFSVTSAADTILSSALQRKWFISVNGMSGLKLAPKLTA